MIYDRSDDPQKHKEAIKLYEFASNYDSESAIYNLALKYEKGKGVKKNLSKSIELLSKASKLGHAPSQYNLGWMYKNGYGIKQNYQEAVRLYSWG